MQKRFNRHPSVDAIESFFFLLEVWMKWIDKWVDRRPMIGMFHLRAFLVVGAGVGVAAMILPMRKWTRFL